MRRKTPIPPAPPKPIEPWLSRAWLRAVRAASRRSSGEDTLRSRIRWRETLKKRAISTQRRHSRAVSRSIRFLQSQRYVAVRIAEPQAENYGRFNILAAGPDGPELIHVCRFIPGAGWPAEETLKSLRELPCPPSCKKVIHRWRNFARNPDAKII